MGILISALKVEAICNSETSICLRYTLPYSQQGVLFNFGVRNTQRYLRVYSETSYGVCKIGEEKKEFMLHASF
jgi:hypothetical protein